LCTQKLLERKLLERKTPNSAKVQRLIDPETQRFSREAAEQGM